MTVSGAGRLIALDDGDQATDRLFNVDTGCFRDGRLLAILRAGRQSGTVEMKVEAEGFAPVVRTFGVAGLGEAK